MTKPLVVLYWVKSNGRPQRQPVDQSPYEDTFATNIIKEGCALNLQDKVFWLWRKLRNTGFVVWR